MCFSPTASFSASAALAVIGVLTLRKTSSVRQEFLFASIPLIFASQQFIEGLLWLLLLKNGSVNTYWLTQSYIIFVGILWPIVPSLSLWMIEPEPARRKMMLPVLATGAGVALYALDAMLKFPVTARIADYCIAYDYPIHMPHFMLIPYVIATCAAFFISSYATITWIGVINICAFTATYYFYSYELASVWCFFAAVISGMIYLYLDERTKDGKLAVS